MDFEADFFRLFDFEPVVQLDTRELAVRFRRLQQEFHPDRFSGHSEQEQRLALQYAAHINQAHQVLSSPVKRCRYLLELQSVDASESNLASDPEFLMAQMALREELEEIPLADDPELALEDFTAARETAIEHLLLEFDRSFEEQAWQQARELVSKMQFQSRLQEEAEALADRMLAE